MSVCMKLTLSCILMLNDDYTPLFSSHRVCANNVHQTKQSVRNTLLDELLDMQKLQTFALDSVRLEKMFTNGMVYSQQDSLPLSIAKKRRVELILGDSGIEQL
uniref:Uncharacterized protein n=1 Tax=Cacopsylla melanoneura TaxID=428564 RepID=A0A8D8SHB9_9HEMI